MPTDAERFRFIAKFRLHVSFHDDHVTLMWQKKVQHWEASPPYFEVASGKTLEEAILTELSHATTESTEFRPHLMSSSAEW
ncbi:MAG TPA: hypothetical protein VGO33_03980 [Gemmatimonadaceae bacterium]|jgi:hypothetical protein|nr:hypothetical protein [Gemmatimonadaceae bacterium]